MDRRTLAHQRYAHLIEEIARALHHRCAFPVYDPFCDAMYLADEAPYFEQGLEGLYELWQQRERYWQQLQNAADLQPCHWMLGRDEQHGEVTLSWSSSDGMLQMYAQEGGDGGGMLGLRVHPAGYYDNNLARVTLRIGPTGQVEEDDEDIFLFAFDGRFSPRREAGTAQLPGPGISPLQATFANDGLDRLIAILRDVPALRHALEVAAEEPYTGVNAQRLIEELASSIP